MNFFQIFKEDNEYDERNIIGFISFAIMVLTAMIDVGTGLVGMDFAIHEYIYNSFVIITLGSFGISGVEHIFTSKKERKQLNEQLKK